MHSRTGSYQAFLHSLAQLPARQAQPVPLVTYIEKRLCELK